MPTEPAETLLQTIRELRAHGELLGPLADRFGAEAVVEALGVAHIACSLGIREVEEEENTDAD